MKFNLLALILNVFRNKLTLNLKARMVDKNLFLVKKIIDLTRLKKNKIIKTQKVSKTLMILCMYVCT